MNMTQEGSNLQMYQIEKILDGEYISEGQVWEHLLIHQLAKIPQFIDKLLSLDEEFDKKTLRKVYEFFSEEDSCYRKNTPVLIHLGYNPVLPQEIDDELNSLFRKVRWEDNKDPVEKAVILHDGIIRIYPFKRWNEIIARAALEYALIYYGEDFCPVTLSEQEYNQAVSYSIIHKKNPVLIQNLRAGILMRKSVEQL